MAKAKKNHTSAPNRIEEWRLKRGFSQRVLADMVKTTPSTINKLETGDMGLTQDWLFKVSKPLGCLPAELLPQSFYQPYLAPAEQKLLGLFRDLDDVEQLRWMKAFAAYCAPISADDIPLTN